MPEKYLNIYLGHCWPVDAVRGKSNMGVIYLITKSVTSLPWIHEPFWQEKNKWVRWIQFSSFIWRPIGELQLPGSCVNSINDWMHFFSGVHGSKKILSSLWLGFSGFLRKKPSAILTNPNPKMRFRVVVIIGIHFFQISVKVAHSIPFSPKN